MCIFVSLKGYLHVKSSKDTKWSRCWCVLENMKIRSHHSRKDLTLLSEVSHANTQSTVCCVSAFMTQLAYEIQHYVHVYACLAHALLVEFKGLPLLMCLYMHCLLDNGMIVYNWPTEHCMTSCYTNRVYVTLLQLVKASMATVTTCTCYITFALYTMIY